MSVYGLFDYVNVSRQEVHFTDGIEQRYGLGIEWFAANNTSLKVELRREHDRAVEGHADGLLVRYRCDAQLISQIIFFRYHFIAHAVDQAARQGKRSSGDEVEPIRRKPRREDGHCADIALQAPYFSKLQ